MNNLEPPPARTSSGLTLDKPRSALDKSGSALADLGLTGEVWTALARQGFVSRDQRTPDRAVFKLRFRLGGRQRVRSLGSDPQQAARIEQELAILQRARRERGELQRCDQAARRTLRQARAALAPLLAQSGYTFHGCLIRRRRRGRPTPDHEAARRPAPGS